MDEFVRAQRSREKRVLFKDLDFHVRRILAGADAILAGGAISSVFMDLPVKDYDIFFRTKENLEQALYPLDALCEDSEDCFKVIETDTACTYSIGTITLQLISMDYILGSPEEVLSKFDFTCCMGAYCFKIGEFVLHKDFLLHLSQRKLAYNINSKFPIASMYRIKKYLKKNFSISGIELIKLSLKINSLNLQTYQNLKEQLMGIDTLFLKPLTDKLLSKYSRQGYDFTDFMEELSSYLEDFTLED